MKCTNCDGQGIVGNGPEPWLQIGHKSTCTKCGGTGQVPAEASAESIDTSESDKPKTGGILSRIFGR